MIGDILFGLVAMGVLLTPADMLMVSILHAFREERWRKERERA